MEKATLRGYFEKKDEELYRKFCSIIDDLKPILNWANQNYYSEHGVKHCENVEQNLNGLLPKKMIKDMPAEEIFCLLVSCWFHDIGLIVERKENESYKERRADHSDRSYDYIHQNYEHWKLEKPYALVIKEICYAHCGNLEKMEEINQSPIIIGRSCVRVKFLSALLRIADELDIGFHRVPKELLTLWKVPEQEKPFLLKDRLTSGVIIDPSSWTIKTQLILSEEDSKYSEIPKKIAQKVNEGLACVRGIFRENGLYYDVVDVDVNQICFWDGKMR